MAANTEGKKSESAGCAFRPSEKLASGRRESEILSFSLPENPRQLTAELPSRGDRNLKRENRSITPLPKSHPDDWKLGAVGFL